MKLNMVVHSWNLEAEAEGLEFEASLRYKGRFEATLWILFINAFLIIVTNGWAEDRRSGR